MKRLTHLILLFVLVGCSSGVTYASSQLPRENVNLSTAQLTPLTEGETKFAFDLYHTLPANGNVIFSPYSIHLAFGMVYAGARGETAQEIAKTLYYPQNVHPALNALSAELERRAQAASDEEKDTFQLHIANALWGQKGYTFRAEYLDLLAQHYGTGVHLVDFQGAPEAGRQEINRWVAQQTRNRIREIVPPGAINSLTRLVLVNAIYFKAAWEHAFNEKETSDAPFFLLDGTEISVPMMHVEAPFRYAAGQGWQAIALPYKGGQTEMVIIVPEKGQFQQVRDSLNAARYQEIRNAMEGKRVVLTLPKFTFESEMRLREKLAALGMKSAFDPEQADFSGIDGSRDLFISEALHKAFIAVDEKGTEATASTAVIFMLTSMPIPENQILLTIDRPFIYFIQDIPSGTILFMGQVTDPR